MAQKKYHVTGIKDEAECEVNDETSSAVADAKSSGCLGCFILIVSAIFILICWIMREDILEFIVSWTSFFASLGLFCLFCLFGLLLLGLVFWYFCSMNDKSE